MPGERPWVPAGRAGGFVVIAIGYALAGIVAWGAMAATGALPLWQRVVIADVAATVVIWLASVGFDNSSFYDPYWSVAPIPVAIGLATLQMESAEVPALRRYVVAALVTIWGLRLTWNWARGWTGFAHEDWRYVDLRRKTGWAYWIVSLLGLHLMPTVTVLLGMSALMPAMLTGTSPIGPLDALAALVMIGAIAIETIADEQLLRFRQGGAQRQILDTGLWAWSRHPNYLGEISLWWGLWLFGVAADASTWWWTLPGPVWMTLLFVLISVPMIDRRSLGRRPAYAEHMRRVPGILPRPWRRAPKR